MPESTSIGENSISSSPQNFQTNYGDAPKEVKDEIDNAVESITLYRNNFVDRDQIVLPRVSLSGVVYIDWLTSNDRIIDLDGKVFQTENERSVVLTGLFRLNGYVKSVNYSLTVGKKRKDSSQISLSDSRITAVQYVSNVEELLIAVKNAQKGSAVVLRDGDYKDVNLQITQSGTTENPIFIMGESVGEVVLSGLTKIEIKGNNVIVANLSFKNGSPLDEKGAIIVRGDNCRITNNNYYKFEDQSQDYKWLSLSAKDTEVDHNVFDGKSVGGALLTIWREDASSQYHHVHHNVFKNYQKGKEANGYETIRIGDSKQSQSDAFCLIENNRFENINGEVEIVSVKSGRNIVKNNVFVSSAGLLTFRHGKNNLAINNVFLCENVKDSGGIRAYDGGHIIKNNYIENVNTSSDSRGAIVIHSGVNVVGETPSLNAQWTAYNVLVENNTVYDSNHSLYFCNKYDFAPQDITIKNNLIIAQNEGAISLFDAKSKIVFESNKINAKSLFDEGSISFLASSVEVDFSNVIPQKQNENSLFLDDTFGAFGLTKTQCGKAGNFE